MMGVLFLTAQCVLLFLSLSKINGHTIHFEKLLLSYKIVSWIVNGIAIILEIVFFGNKQIFLISCISSILICGLIEIIFDIFSARKYFAILKNRIIEIISENTVFLRENEIRVKLFEKYDHMYCISDIKKILKKI